MTKINIKSSQDKYNNYIVEILKERDCELSSEICKSLNKKFGLSDDNARQVLKRTVQSQVIKSSSPTTFGKGQFAYSISGNLKINAVIRISKNNRPPLYRLLKQMQLNDGIISFYEGIKISVGVIERSSSKVSSFDELLKICLDLDFAYRYKDNNNIDYLVLKQKGKVLDEKAQSTLASQHYQKMVLDCTLLPDILVWLQKVNILASGPIYRNKTTPGIGCIHNKLVWDAYGYTKTTGINIRQATTGNEGDKGTLVVLDVILSTEYTEIFLNGFYERIQININSTKGGQRKVFPIIIFNSINAIVRNKIKKLGFLAFDLSAIFGSKITEVINKTNMLPQLLSSPETLAKEVSQILKSIENAGQLDALSALRGTLFEFLMYPLIKNRFPDSIIDRGRTLTVTNEIEGKNVKEYYEYDFIIHNNQPKEIVIVELKGYHSGFRINVGPYDKKSTLKWFFNTTLPFARKFYKKERADYPVKGVYITTAYYADDCDEIINKLKESIKLRPSSLDITYDRDQLLELLTTFEMKNEIKTIERFFIKDEN